MSFSRLAKSLLLSLAIFGAPAAAFAQVDAIRSGVTAAAGAQGANLTLTECQEMDCVVGIIGNVVRVAIGFAGVLLLLYLLYAGFLWMTAGGETKNVTTAQEMIKNAVAGLVLIVASFAISSFVLDQLGSALTGQSSTAPAGASGSAATPAATPEPAVGGGA